MESLSIDLGRRVLDFESRPVHGSALLDALGSLVTYDELTDVVILSHFSVKVCSALPTVRDLTWLSCYLGRSTWWESSLAPSIRHIISTNKLLTHSWLYFARVTSLPTSSAVSDRACMKDYLVTRTAQ